MRRRIAIAAIPVVVGVLLFALRGSDDHDPLAARAPRTAPAATPSQRTGSPRAEVPVEDPDVASPEPWQQTFAARTARVREACHLDVQTACNADACVALTTAPDLDRFAGWVELLGRNPELVISTVARDLGVPVDVIPCGSAIADMSDQPATGSVALPDGSEVWCMPTDPTGQPSWDRAQRDLCDRLATRLIGPAAAGFGADDLRILTFDR